MNNKITRIGTATARILLGLMFAFSGINGFLNLLPQDTAGMPGDAVAFLNALGATGYMMEMTKAVEIVVGILLLVNRFVPLALALLAPLTVNIFLFHAFLLPDGLIMVVVIAALHLYLAWGHRDAFAPMLRAKSRRPALDDEARDDQGGRGQERSGDHLAGRTV